ncbi:MAG: DegT/DnrJ/EryC1/StrS family aminotransferase [Dysgonamonadaceae bacterium]|jgi:dTDP-4-amino-4,6-dideoxygalactose transaminase|nr:DegT/DnrJ/EryC1/StrS family aminotransferase [Dysgonamonadaceae bacterium]
MKITRQYHIPLSNPHASGKESDYVREAIDSGWITTLGPQVDRFENRLAFYLQTSGEVVAVNSGTAAIHLALRRLGVGVDDEVICQDFTFVASVNPVVYLGATPVLVDSEKDTWNMSPALLKIAIEDRLRKTGQYPKAIIPVNLYGMPANLEAINRIAAKYGIPVLEDAAESLGSYIYKGSEKHFCGTLGKYACLSFNGNKIITTSGGGALVCPDFAEAEAVRFLATQARDEAPHYQHSQMGYNYRLSNVCAAVGLAQLEVLQSRINRRRAIHFLYKKALQGLNLIFQDEPAGFFSNYWLTCVLFAGKVSRERVRQHLEAAGVESRPLWKPMHLQPLYEKTPFYGDGTDKSLFDCGLCLPSGSAMTDEEVHFVCNAIKEALGELYNNEKRKMKNEK